RGCNPAYSKSIHTWLRFGEIMRGSLRVKSAIRDIKKRFKKRNLKAAEKYLERQGCHPLWDEDSIQDIFKG
ncbi:hypothetical protein P3439_18845, partial [Vibrio parahaemolyticus]|nr:hypothetical protein [Vibrio parahaemolyticus]